MKRFCTPLRRLALIGLLAMAGNAGAVTITREFSASWFDPGHAGHGFSLEVVSAAQEKNLVVYWFTFDTSGRQIWLVGAGPIDGDGATVRVAESQGGAFDNGFDPARVTSRPWGTLQFAFSGCDDGNVRFSPDDSRLPRGSMPIKRLTSLHNAACSGGISDDRPSSSGDLRIVQFLQPASGVTQASGKIEFEQRSRSTDFKVEVEDLPAGSYTVRVGGRSRGTLRVDGPANDRRGSLEFRSPADAGHALLDFDPRGQRVEVSSGSSVVLSATLGSGAGGGSTGGGGIAPISGRYVMHVESGGRDGPELSAELEGRTGRTDFSVEAEDVPAGSYTVRIGGSDRGALTVRAVPGGTHGEIEFSAPVEPGKSLLDFDPRGSVIELVRNGVVLSGVFPTTPSAGSGGGGDDHGGGGGDDHGGGGGDDHGGGGDDHDGGGGDDHGGGGGDDHGGGGGDDHGGGGGDDHGGHGGG